MKKLLLFLQTICFAAQVSIMNDSPFPLGVQLISATGELLGTTQLEPQATQRWTSNYTDNYSSSMTPFTVIFTCHDGGEYGVVTNVATGAMVTASGAQGRQFCKPKKKKDGAKPPETKGSFLDQQLN